MNVLMQFLSNNLLFGALIDADEILHNALRTIGFVLCNFLYKTVSFLYQLFMVLCRVRILDADGVNVIYRRVTILLGLLMMFVVIFYLIKLLLSPEKVNDKEMGLGNLLKKIVVVVVLIGFTPLLFEIAYDIQDAVLDSNIIAKVILGTNVPDSDDLTTGYGREMSASMFTAFYTENPAASKGCSAGSPIEDAVIDDFIQNGTFSVADQCLNEKDGEEYVIDFDGIPAIIAGGVMIYVLLNYVIKVGVRVIQFTFLQFISPIPIISYILPKGKQDTLFDRWVKQVMATYTDLFVRTAIIYFVIFLSKIIWNLDLFSGSTVGSSLLQTMSTWATVVLIIALYFFAIRLPQLLQELVGKPSAASLGFGVGDTDVVHAGFSAITMGGGFAGFRNATIATQREGYRGYQGAMRDIRAENYMDSEMRAEGLNYFQRGLTRFARNRGLLGPEDVINAAAAYDDQINQSFNADDTYAKFNEIKKAMDGGQTNEYHDLSTGIIWRRNGSQYSAFREEKRDKLDANGQVMRDNNGNPIQETVEVAADLSDAKRAAPDWGKSAYNGNTFDFDEYADQMWNNDAAIKMGRRQLGALQFHNRTFFRGDAGHNGRKRWKTDGFKARKGRKRTQVNIRRRG